MRADIVLGAITLIMTVLGAIVSLHAPEKRTWKLGYGAAFLALGVAATVYVIKQSNETEQVTNKLSGALTDVAHSTQEITRMTDLNTKLQTKLLKQSGTISSLAKRSISSVTGEIHFAI
jgi:uncharacterized protein YdaL